MYVQINYNTKLKVIKFSISVGIKNFSYFRQTWYLLNKNEGNLFRFKL